MYNISFELRAEQTEKNCTILNALYACHEKYPKNSCMLSKSFVSEPNKSSLKIMKSMYTYHNVVKI